MFDNRYFVVSKVFSTLVSNWKQKNASFLECHYMIEFHLSGFVTCNLFHAFSFTVNIEIDLIKKQIFPDLVLYFSQDFFAWDKFLDRLFEFFLSQNFFFVLNVEATFEIFVLSKKCASTTADYLYLKDSKISPFILKIF